MTQTKFIIDPAKLGFELYEDRATFMAHNDHQSPKQNYPHETPYPEPDRYPVWAREEFTLNKRDSANWTIFTYLYQDELEALPVTPVTE